MPPFPRAPLPPVNPIHKEAHMKVIVYRTNRDQDQDFEDEVRLELEAQFPAAKVRVCNPKYFTESTMEAADLVYVKPAIVSVRNAYVAAGIEVRTDGANAGPVVIPLSPELDPDEEVVLFQDPYEEDINRLVAKTTKGLKDALSRVFDVDLIRATIEAEKAGRARKSCLEVYAAKLATLGE